MANLDTSIRRYADSQEADYIEVCSCSEPEKCLRLDIATKTYYGAYGCDEKNACAILQINKHKISISMKRRRLLDPTFNNKKKEHKIMKDPNDQTIDQFFG